MQMPAPAENRLCLIAPPYDRFHDPHSLALRDAIGMRGTAFVWWLIDGVEQKPEFDFLLIRPANVPLVVVLPPPEEIVPTLPLLKQVRRLNARAVLPAGIMDTPRRIRDLLNVPPAPFGATVTQYIVRRGVISDPAIERTVQRIMELAPDTRTITQLAKRLYTSRRTLGRQFAAAGLPVPSHWLQFARLLHVALRLQREPHAVFRIAMRMGYTDGFTFSNQMKRLIGLRPTEVRDYVGWEWIVEAWLQNEGL
jgi:AraC-like DNA-binding protein